jgi:hypothetical protein
MEENQIIKAITSTLTDAPIYEMVIPVRWVPKRKRSLWEWITRKPITSHETHRKFIFYPSVVANQYRIAGESALLTDVLYDDTRRNLQFIPEHQKHIVYTVAAAIQNNHLEPEQDLIEFIERNFTGHQLREALMASFQTLNMEAFTDTIVLMKGTVRMMKTSPTDGKELIASHTEQ